MTGTTSHKTRSWLVVSPWIVIGAVIVLVPMVIFMALFSIEKQHDAMTRLLAEKGDALIRSLEAGVRAGRAGSSDAHWRMVQLLTEMARQPDIVYLLITDVNGFVIAHSNPQAVGGYHGLDLDLRELAARRSLYYRTVANAEQGDVFEVFRSFNPPPDTVRPPRERSIPDDLFRGDTPEQPSLMVFLGLDRGPVASALQADTRVTAVMALVLLLIGFTGVVSLLVVQGYRQARISLAHARAFSDNLVEHLPIGLIATDGSSLITSCNPVAETLLGIASADVLGSDIHAALRPELTNLLARDTTGRWVIEGEITYPAGPDRTVPLDVIAAALGENDSFTGFVILIRDLTEVKRLQKEVDRSRRMASLGHMAAGVAHEIRNPLSSIKGFATYFRERYRDVPEDQKTADIMIREVDRLNRVIGTLLEFSRPLPMSRTAVSTRSLITRLHEMIAPWTAERNIALEMLLPRGDRQIEGDSDGLSQALLNLSINAVEAMEKGGRLVLSAEFGTSRVTLSIADTGPGIEPQNLSKIFDPYYTTKASGTGLGLAIVHKIVEAHGGDLQVESRPGRGSTFSIALPLRPAEGGTGEERRTDET